MSAQNSGFLTTFRNCCAPIDAFFHPSRVLKRQLGRSKRLRSPFPRIVAMASLARIGPVETIEVPIPADCRDGFLGAYWKRPHAYLDPMVREGISTFSKIGDVDSQLARLERDIDSGAWEQRYAGLKDLEVLDLGYRILISHRGSGASTR